MPAVDVVGGRCITVITGRGEGKNFEHVGEVLLRAEEAGGVAIEAQQDHGAYKIWLNAAQRPGETPAMPLTELGCNVPNMVFFMLGATPEPAD